MKRSIISIISGVFAIIMLVTLIVYGGDMGLSQKAIFFLCISVVFVLKILSELLYLWFVRKMLNTSAVDAVPLWGGLKIIRDKEFACPNCGSHFKKKWWLYTFSFLRHRAIALFTFGKTNFRCPHCKKFDTCVIVENHR